jgi:hypothetical protein
MGGDSLFRRESERTPAVSSTSLPDLTSYESRLLGDGRNLAAELQPADDASQRWDEMKQAVTVIQFAPDDGRLRASRPRVEIGTRQSIATFVAAAKDAGFRQLLHMRSCVHGWICSRRV